MKKILSPVIIKGKFVFSTPYTMSDCGKFINQSAAVRRSLIRISNMAYFCEIYIRNALPTVQLGQRPDLVTQQSVHTVQLGQKLHYITHYVMRHLPLSQNRDCVTYCKSTVQLEQRLDYAIDYITRYVPSSQGLRLCSFASFTSSITI